MSLNKSQLSLLITIFSMAIVVLGLYNVHLGSSEKEEYVVELALLEEDPEELLDEEEQELQDQKEAEAIKSHMAFNETAKASQGNPEPLKTLEELMEEAENASDSDEPNELLTSDSGAYAANLKELKKKRQEAKQLLGEREAQKDVPTNNLAKRRTSISYSLIDRNHYNLPVPIYTCIEGGKIVVNIVVDSQGTVTDANFNKSSSSTSNGCLIDNALEYAYKASFNKSTKDSQKGTITYLFQEKAR
ncbi:hypothetical protein Celal_1040 [Cellulophaga algicola DSM 14237]|uniref:TonB family protein n=1 Tax=Cellulophaga algicola (strain DSM 14237 / IC166 / ACAM 630) TaxID=688270 RepID=E6X554_CELAD|nr:energy transducer TonB [Cellulophaga algicola]ADV48365.1 hypothetical protein Celal_1040 [Cellulophaga algicola DSM 14237]